MSRRLFSIQIESDGPVTASVDSVATEGPPVSSETYPRLEARSRLVRSALPRCFYHPSARQEPSAERLTA
jgi:hypothetical protein